MMLRSPERALLSDESWPWVRFAALALCGVVMMGCPGPERLTVVELEVRTAGLTLDQIRFTVTRAGEMVGEPQTLPEVAGAPLSTTAESVAILLPADLAGSVVGLQAEGLLDAQVVGVGEATVVPVAGETVTVVIELEAPGVCGDGVVGPGEACDDGNPGGGDGCDDDCAVEVGYTCLGEPSICRPSCARDDDCDQFCDVARGQCVPDSDILYVDCGAGCPGDGSPSSPLCSLSDAVDRSVDGQHVVLQPGTCDEAIAIVELRMRIVGIDQPVIRVETCPAVLVRGGDVTLEGLVIRGSGPSTARQGGGLRVRAGAVLRLVRSQVLLAACTGIECQDASCDIAQTAVAFNAGGGILMDGSSFRIVNSIIGRNGSDSTSWGGVLVDAPGASPAAIVNCDVLANSVDEPVGGVGGVRCDTPATVVNSILWDNDGREVSAGCVVRYSDVAEPALDGLDGNTNQPPMFVDPAGFDFHLDPASPCIDKGDPDGVPPAPTEDFEGNPRPLGGGVDLGAFESG